MTFLEQHVDVLDEDCKRRMYSNPLRVLDSKNPDVQLLLNDAPKLSDYLDDESKQHFAGLCELLNQAGIPYTVNERLVRGLDYYNRTVFEWVTNSLGAQGTVCAGGRYDGLVEQLGGVPHLLLVLRWGLSVWFCWYKPLIQSLKYLRLLMCISSHRVRERKVRRCSWQNVCVMFYRP